jgi:hypothetical protein
MSGTLGDEKTIVGLKQEAPDRLGVAPGDRCTRQRGAAASPQHSSSRQMGR